MTIQLMSTNHCSVLRCMKFWMLLFIFYLFFKYINIFPFHSLINYLQMTQFCIWFSSLWLSTNSEWIINDVCCSEQTIKFSKLSKTKRDKQSDSESLLEYVGPVAFFFFLLLLLLLLLFVRAPGNVLVNCSLRFISFPPPSQFIFWQLNSASLSLQVGVWLTSCYISVNKRLKVQENSASFTVFCVKHDQCMNIEMS